MNDETPTPADENVERLIGEAYRPDAIDLGFAERTMARLERLSAERRLLSDPKRRILWLAFANAAAILMLIALPPLFWHYFGDHSEDEQASQVKGADSPADRMTPRPRYKLKPPPKLEIGQTAATTAGEKKKLRLADQSAVLLNQSTRIRLDSARKLTLLEGEIFLEIAAGKQAQEQTPFAVAAPGREITAIGSHFAVRTVGQGSSVVVTQGQVKVSGIAEPLSAGQRVEAGSDRPAASARASHELEWASALFDEETLVPSSEYRGGALVARGLDGQEARLSLRMYHVDVFIEDGFARTTIDQTYFNHQFGRLEGTFHFPLPADASLSRLAMYVDGTRMEGGMVEREYGRSVFDSIVKTQRDPALLEWVDGTTFKMRVFPLEGRQEKRIILSYTQRLPAQYGKTTYRFPSGHSLDEVGEWSLAIRVKQGEKLAWNSNTHALTARLEKGDLQLTASASKMKLDGDVVVELKDPAFTGGEQARFATAEYQGQNYLMLRYRPELNETPRSRREPRAWVILFESSAERDPVLARTQVEIVRHLLENAEPDDTFTLLAAATRTRTLTPKPLPATAANIRSALAELDHTQIIGGFDLSAALIEAESHFNKLKNAFLVHVGSGFPRLGERREEKLLALLPQHFRYVGIGVGKSWNRSFMKGAAERTGGLFVQINPDEPVNWRTFDLLATLNTPRLLGVRVSDAKGTFNFLTATSLLAQGEELCAVARTALEQKAWPEMVTITGTLDGKPIRRELKLTDVARNASYLPRTWGRLEIDRLVAEDSKKNKEAIVELSKSLYVMSPFTSLLVLETEEMYKRFKVDRGRKDHWAMYDCPEKIPVYFEPLGAPREEVVPGQPLTAGKKPSEEQVRNTLMVRDMPLRFRQAGSDLRTEGLWDIASDPINLRMDSKWKLQTRARVALTELPIVVDGVLPPFGQTNFDIIQRINQLVSQREDGSPQLKPIARRNIFSNPTTEQHKEELTRFLDPRWTHVDGEWRSLAWDSGEQLQDTFRGLQGVLEIRDSVHGSQRFRDLLFYAPGLNSSAADIESVVEAEAASLRSPVRGYVDERARSILNKARVSGWRETALTGTLAHDGFTVDFDSSGRFRFERTLSTGLRETVICDGTNLLHLYPEIGLGARRTIRRSHRLELFAAIPALLPSADDLASDADLVLHDDSTVGVLPHHGRHTMQLIFGKDGRLAETKLLSRDGKKLLKGVTVNAKANQTAPDLKPDLRGLVVLPMPWRTFDHVQPVDPVAKQFDLKKADEQTALAMLAASFVSERHRLPEIVKDWFHARGDRRPGLIVLAVAAGFPVDKFFPNEKSKDPLLAYLERVAVKGDRADRKDEKEDGKKEAIPLDFVARMTALHELFLLSQQNRIISVEREQHLHEAIRTCKNPLLLWCLTEAFAAAFETEETISQSRGTMFCGFLDELSKALREIPGLGQAAAYESGKALWRTGQKNAARKAFLSLHQAELSQGRLIAADAAFRDALGPDAWRKAMREAASELGRKDSLAVLAVAELSGSLGSSDLADELIRKAVAAGDTRTSLAAVDYLCRVNRLTLANELITTLLDGKKTATDPEVWRMAAQVATLLHRTPRAIANLEKALELEWKERPSVYDLKDIRRDYDSLLGHYKSLARAADALEQERPAGLADRALQAIERWRTLDPHGPAAEKAVDVLLALGQREWAWEYLTTHLSTVEQTSELWQTRAATRRQQHDYVLAERCLVEAQAIEPENASLLLEQAKVLREAGRPSAARGVLRRLVGGKWADGYREVISEAREMMGE